MMSRAQIVLRAWRELHTAHMHTVPIPILERLLADCVGVPAAQAVLMSVDTPEFLRVQRGEVVPRAVIAEALNLALFHGLLTRVPAAKQRIADVVGAGNRVHFDHGALRTVVTSLGNLPSGFHAFSRILEPLGFRISGTYTLSHIRMIGRSFTHQDAPGDIAQFFVSELSIASFSDAFQRAARSIISTSKDPLTATAAGQLDRLARTRSLPYAEAATLLPALLLCFGRQHATAALADYDTVLAESAEMAWIATEGNTFNHVTERVSDIASLAEDQKRLGRPMKDAIEISASGRIKQTAYFAASVDRQFVNRTGKLTSRVVPGSFYEFIERGHVRDSRGEMRMDLSFDSSNAQGIFRMTAGHERRDPGPGGYTQRRGTTALASASTTDAAS